MTLDHARQIADTVLYEGYLLYPYRAGQGKNQTRVRWQFGVLVPEAHAGTPTGPATVSGATESHYSRTECIVEEVADTRIDLRLRFLRLQSRKVEPDGSTAETSGDEGTPSELDCSFTLDDLRTGEQELLFELPATTEVDGGVTRCREAVTLRLQVAAEAFPGPYGIARVRAVITNITDWSQPDATRDLVLARSTIATHLLMEVSGGRFVSLSDPPEWAKPAVASCTNEHTWPVLVGSQSNDTMLSAPMVLPDFPEVAPESPTDLFDGLENDEILSLRIMTLTDEEKAEARASDPRVAAIFDTVDNLPPELYERLHGAIRSLEGGPAKSGEPAFPELWTDEFGEVKEPKVPGTKEGVPWWDPGADASVSPDTDSVLIAGVDVARGSKVILRPGGTRTDAQDMFLVGRTAMVAAVLFDVEDEAYLAVTLDDDPGADIMQAHGRYLYFKPSEVEPLGSVQEASS
jgi:hypothetical protein